MLNEPFSVTLTDACIRALPSCYITSKHTCKVWLKGLATRLDHYTALSPFGCRVDSFRLGERLWERSFVVKLCLKRAFWEALRLVNHLWPTKYMYINVNLKCDIYSIHHVWKGMLRALPATKRCLVTGV